MIDDDDDHDDGSYWLFSMRIMRIYFIKPHINDHYDKMSQEELKRFASHGILECAADKLWAKITVTRRWASIVVS
jgi:succinate dehydrogenase flavin-adding protein (antitoxin of CptAB toxin-antitoxin module)